MIRTILYLLVAVFLITLVRAFIGIIGRAVGDLLQPGSSAGGRTSAQPPKVAGELKKDPVCGAYVPAATSPTKTVNGELVYFCSPECREKYRG
jgi:YHS domain-containing protein